LEKLHYTLDVGTEVMTLFTRRNWQNTREKVCSRRSVSPSLVTSLTKCMCSTSWRRTQRRYGASSSSKGTSMSVGRWSRQHSRLLVLYGGVA